ncbi:class II fructose-bisphosphatase [Paenibacillus sp. 7124]|uniref:Fructose-1,6-bisphosphatase n=2 Tax=Paenibacillus TaxID=44249 RepID=A0A6M1PRC6_9BACL|nr:MULTISPECIES: class II fructose-bisphosphatase [Paenibacillus]AHV95974.1 fructose 1,6-bisphosphatase II [Paenibacillus sabinae T27]NGM82781.1 class II fructose-bisphosphatase [Paenibacillus apii]NJJ39922.1 class II fructose-bisphosphatase [Paenibacillus apii]
MERELALEIVRVTELGALASASWIGRGDKDAADDAATTAIRSMFDSVSIDGTVVIGEGEMDDAPMLYIGEKVGNKSGPLVDVAVDPLEGTEVVAAGLQNAQSVIAIAEKGSLLHAPDIYMQKLACGPELAGKLSLEDPVEITLTKASHHLGKPLSELTVMVLDRDRHKDLIQTLRQAGVRIKLLSHGDVAGAIAAALPDSEVDLYLGSGGAPEGVLAAAALKCLGGEMQGQLLPQGPFELQRCMRMGIANPTRVLYMDDMVGTGDVIFAATGVTSGEFLNGVRLIGKERAETHSVIMRAQSRTIRYIRSIHFLPGKDIPQVSPGRKVASL